MTELDQVWSQMLDKADEIATAGGRRHLADYLRLRATNDAIRTRGVKWLFDTLIAIAADLQRDHHGLTIEREDPYSFKPGNSTMVGSALFIRHGVRCLTLEAGWARIPADGIMQRGALAYARLDHFGRSRDNAEVRLVFDESLPNWLDETGTAIDHAFLETHIDRFLA